MRVKSSTSLYCVVTQCFDRYNICLLFLFIAADSNFRLQNVMQEIYQRNTIGELNKFAYETKGLTTFSRHFDEGWYTIPFNKHQAWPLYIGLQMDVQYEHFIMYKMYKMYYTVTERYYTYIEVWPREGHYGPSDRLFAFILQSRTKPNIERHTLQRKRSPPRFEHGTSELRTRCSTTRSLSTFVLTGTQGAIITQIKCTF